MKLASLVGLSLLCSPHLACGQTIFPFTGAPVIRAPRPAPPPPPLAMNDITSGAKSFWLIGQGEPTNALLHVRPSASCPGRCYSIAGEADGKFPGVWGDKVGVYGAARGGISGNAWGGNFLVQLDKDSHDAIIQGIEVDVVNDLSPNAMAQVGINVTAGGLYESSTGILVSSVKKEWKQGLIIERATDSLTVIAGKGYPLKVYDKSMKTLVSIDANGLIRLPGLAQEGGGSYLCVNEDGIVYSNKGGCE